jgi:hypothetical protein
MIGAEWRLGALHVLLLSFHVMPGFMPGIHVLATSQDVDGRDKPGHDDGEA